MKKIFYTFLLISPLLFISSCDKDDEAQSETNIEIGAVFQGGIIFYIDETGEHGLVAALEDLTEGATDPYGWGFNGYEWGVMSKL